MIYIREELRPLFTGETTVDDFMQIEGEVVKQVVKSRRITRFERGGRHFYMKCHYGVGWKEIFKNLLSLRLPVTSARNELRALRALKDIGIDTMQVAAFGMHGINPATVKSFIITDALEGTQDVEHWLAGAGKYHPMQRGIRMKRRIFTQIGKIAGQLHRNGINHRDFYLCHFRLDLTAQDSGVTTGGPRLYLMDLHRAQIRERVPMRWLVKDLSGLLYSGLYSPLGLPVTLRDYARLLEAYCGVPWRECLKQRRGLWKKVIGRTIRDAGRAGLDSGKLSSLLKSQTFTDHGRAI